MLPVEHAKASTASAAATAGMESNSQLMLRSILPTWCGLPTFMALSQSASRWHSRSQPGGMSGSAGIVGACGWHGAWAGMRTCDEQASRQQGAWRKGAGRAAATDRRPRLGSRTAGQEGPEGGAWLSSAGVARLQRVPSARCGRPPDTPPTRACTRHQPAPAPAPLPANNFWV